MFFPITLLYLHHQYTIMSTALPVRLKTAAQITRGLFLTDAKRSVFGRIWQLFSRFTWESPQTIVGWLYTFVRALVGQVDRVDVLGGITFATKTDSDSWMGVSLGTFVDIWQGFERSGENDVYVLGSQLYLHEFGHTADSQRFGLTYLFVIGLPSLLNTIGKGNHRVYWTEIRANRHAQRYFAKHYSVAWDFTGYPIENKA